MFILKKVGCRLFQTLFRIALPILPYREPKIVPSCSELGNVLLKERSDSVLVVTDAGIIKNGLTSSLEKVLKKNNVQYTIYDKTQPNPVVENVGEALALYHKNSCDTLIAIGGGSAMDCAKAVGARAVCREIKKQYGEEPLKNKDYGKIINEKHFGRLCGLIDEKKVVIGGNTDPATCQIAPTVMDNVTEDDAVMGEEIFGPIMPILTFDDFDNVVDRLKAKDKPLALYLFTSNKKHVKRVMTELSYGGGCINDVVIHLATSAMGFGGVGESGMGAYHGKDGFDAFSHYKSIVDKKTWLDLPMRYQPYKSKLYEKLLHIFLR